MIRLAATLIWLAALGVPAFAQDRAGTIADMRAELSDLAGALQSLRSELVAGGGAGFEAAGGTSAIDRMNAIEAELVRLTAQTEALQNMVNRVISDGTNRIGDLEFRLCELDEGCDVGALPITKSLGWSGDGPVQPPVSATTGVPELAMSEQADFDRARGVLDQGDFRGAADLFATFAETYPGGPLTGEAHYLRGEALSQLGQTSEAARAYLEGFSGQPDGPQAGPSLLRLGQSLAELGQVQEACVTLGEVPVRFSATIAADEASATMRNLGCP